MIGEDVKGIIWEVQAMLSVALSRLQNLGIWCEDGQVCSADGEKIKKEFFEEVKKLAFQMINSFETSLSMFFAKTENIYELAQSERLQELYEMVIKEQDELIAIHGFGRIALAARIDSNDTIFRGEILQLVLENLTREGQAGNEDQRFTFAMRKPPNKTYKSNWVV